MSLIEAAAEEFELIAPTGESLNVIRSLVFFSQYGVDAIQRRIEQLLYPGCSQAVGVTGQLFQLHDIIRRTETGETFRVVGINEKENCHIGKIELLPYKVYRVEK